MAGGQEIIIRSGRHETGIGRNQTASLRQVVAIEIIVEENGTARDANGHRRAICENGKILIDGAERSELRQSASTNIESPKARVGGRLPSHSKHEIFSEQKINKKRLGNRILLAGFLNILRIGVES